MEASNTTQAEGRWDIFSVLEANSALFDVHHKAREHNVVIFLCAFALAQARTTCCADCAHEMLITYACVDC